MRFRLCDHRACPVAQAVHRFLGAGVQRLDRLVGDLDRPLGDLSVDGPQPLHARRITVLDIFVCSAAFQAERNVIFRC
jgi:hypothetical protein